MENSNNNNFTIAHGHHFDFYLKYDDTYEPFNDERLVHTYRQAKKDAVDALCWCLGEYIRENKDIRQIMDGMSTNKRDFCVQKLTLSVRKGYHEYSAMLHLWDGINAHRCPAWYFISVKMFDEENAGDVRGKTHKIGIQILAVFFYKLRVGHLCVAEEDGLRA
ncbi:hypothetical protein SCHPADRAFT_887789 [Schizopora paradoxa]|uniref:Uncharacterized protein n=1 Tax=Schizopora paradoxa TaxID=27342 RepID=A0A0H2RWR3_9AGAM|nr:hypothetical protein SCHPADRAFT_887789 [Schizopora paradoxa]